MASATMTPLPPSSADFVTMSDTGTPPPGRPGEGPLRAGDAFGPRYRILRVLGAGGMGVVYHAWDDELGVAVALKVIRPEVMGDPEGAREVERRFKRELVLARQVTHRHVVRIHDLGDVDGIKYLTMPFVNGSDLGSILREEGALPVARALHIAKQIAAGLLAAHEAGVVHRDLKPENIMIDEDDQALIMDFGISRSLSGTGAGTVMGAVVGTLEYMAPEQGRGQPTDQRADIYAFGLMLYDMIAGRTRLHTAEGAVAEMMSRMTQAPPKLGTRIGQMPQVLEAIVARCLEPDPAKRYQSTAELVADLDALDSDGRRRPAAAARGGVKTWIAWAVAFVALALAIVIVWRGWTPATPPTARAPVSVVIADFENRTNDPLFEGSLEQALGIGLEDAAFIVAYPRSDAMRFIQQIAPGRRLDEERARLLARREGIKIVLASSIASSGSGYLIEVRAIDPIPGTDLAKVSTSASSKGEVLQAMARLASDVREFLGDTTPESAKMGALETFTSSSLEAAREYSLAQTLANGNKDEEAIARYRSALELDPKFGRAYSGWALSAGKLGRTQESADLWKKALENLDRMTEREKYRTLGNYYRVGGNHEKALESYQMLVEKYPADGAAHNNLALAYFDTLEFVKARDEGARVVQIYPGSVLYRYNHALYAMYAGDFGTAEKEGRQALSINPETPKAYVAIAVAALMRQDAAGAKTAYEEAAQRAGARGVSFSRVGLADIAMYHGRHADAVPHLEAGITDDLAGKNVAGAAAKLVALGEARLALGDKRAAAEAAQRAASLIRRHDVAAAAARILIAAGRPGEARPLIDYLAGELQPRPRAYAALLGGEAALARGQEREAIEALRAALKLADLWLVRLALGLAYLEADHPAEALSEFEACLRRRGEATAVYLDDVPTVRYLAPVPYWLGRAHEGVGTKTSAAENYRAYLALRQPASDPLAADAERRLKSLQ